MGLKQGTESRNDVRGRRGRVVGISAGPLARTTSIEGQRLRAGTGADLQKPPFTGDIYLTDGGVYDNLGLETAWKVYDTILVSDGGGKMALDPEPHTDWARHALRINE